MTTHAAIAIVGVLALCATRSFSIGQTNDTSPQAQTNGQSMVADAGYTNALMTEVMRFTAEQETGARGNTNIMVRRGLVADREKRRIDLLAASTGVTAKGPVEFLFISPMSGHDYEALAIAAVEPGDLHRALTFIGLNAGRSVNVENLQFWPKGERVNITVSSRDTNYWTGRISAESLVLDSDSGNAMASRGFVFVGSRWIPSRHSTNMLYLADVADPHSIVSLYNEIGTVLDLPEQAHQGAVYGTRLVNPDYAMPADTLFDVRIEPERAAGSPRIRDLTLNIAGVPGGQPGLAGVKASLFEGSVPIARETSISEALQHLKKLTDRDFDPFVVLVYDKTVTLEQARAVSEVLAALEGEGGIRIEPPTDGQLYFKAFIPIEKYRKRADRYAQPWELRLFSPGSTNLTTLTQIEEKWNDDSIHPELIPTDFPVTSPESLRHLIDEHGPGLKVIIVFADARLTHGDLMRMLAPVMSTHGTIHVFVD